MSRRQQGRLPHRHDADASAGCLRRRPGAHPDDDGAGGGQGQHQQRVGDHSGRARRPPRSEGGSRYYFGVLIRLTRPASRGSATSAGPPRWAGTRVGPIRSRRTSGDTTGGRSHAPCGGARNPDTHYPYAGGTIGVYGFDVAAQQPRAADLVGRDGLLQQRVDQRLHVHRRVELPRRSRPTSPRGSRRRCSRVSWSGDESWTVSPCWSRRSRS